MNRAAGAPIDQAQRLNAISRRVEQENLQLFRSFLNRMGPADRRRMLAALPDVAHMFRRMFDLGETADVRRSLNVFVRSRGDINLDGPLSRIQGVKRELELIRDVDEAAEFRYRDLDRFLQFLFDHRDTMMEHVVNAQAECGVDPVFLRALHPAVGANYVAEFFNRAGNRRSGTLPPAVRNGLESLMNAFVVMGCYTKEDEAVGRALAESLLIMTSESDDTGGAEGGEGEDNQ